ncbi:MAG: hypothetical protein IJJ61_05525 [Clostridia bacterium]|nr:hypothetical protein [Clostridia bacterium]MBQ6467386.1 hypothetical protein [Clostridia bacterium]
MLNKEIIIKTENAINKLINVFNNRIPMPPHIKHLADIEQLTSGKGINYISETDNYWKLGYNECSIKPLDIDSKRYFVGGNISVPPRKITHVIDDIKVRTIALSTEHSKVIVLSVIDCIGLSSPYVSVIREHLADFCKLNSIITINVFSTHCHSSIDSLGIWSTGVKDFFLNYMSARHDKIPKPTIDTCFINMVLKKVEDSIIAAVKNMKLGRLFLLEIGNKSSNEINEIIKNSIDTYDNEKDCVKKERWQNEFSKLDISETGLYEYIFSKRYPYDFSPRITRIRFKPIDESVRETIIISISAHPYSNGLKIRGEGKGNGLSGDFIYYMEETFNNNNCNMIFFNGAIGGIYPKRKAVKDSKIGLKEQTKIIGNEFAGIALSANMTYKEILSNKTTCPSDKSLAYKNVINHKKADHPLEEKEIKAVFKTCNKKVKLKCSNPIEQIIGKLNLAQFNLFSTPTKDLYVGSEIGYIQLGNEFNIVFVPGEMTNSLFDGHYDYKMFNNSNNNVNSIIDIFGEKTVVFGLANDAIGYIIHPDDYCMVYAGNGFFSKLVFGQHFTHYQEIFSLGKETAGKLLVEYTELFNN